MSSEPPGPAFVASCGPKGVRSLLTQLVSHLGRNLLDSVFSKSRVH